MSSEDLICCSSRKYQVMLFLHSEKARDKMFPCPFSSILNTSMTEAPSRLRILHNPSQLTTVFSPILEFSFAIHATRRQDDLHSRKLAAKLIHMLPSQLFPPTFPGMLCVSISSMRNRIPCRSRKPTIIFGTPRRKAWAQNLRSFLSYFIMSRSPYISAVVFSSTQLIGSSFLFGLQSHTDQGVISGQHGIYFSFWLASNTKIFQIDPLPYLHLPLLQWQVLTCQSPSAQ